MKKLLYLIVAIAILGLIVPGCIPVVPPAEQGDLSTLTKNTPSTWYVDGVLGTDDGSHGIGTGVSAFKTIQYAINDSRVQDGDTIIVAAGTYNGFDANKDGIKVKAASTPKITASPITVDGQDNAIVVSAHNVTIDGFTIDAPQFSTGIKIYNATTPPHGAVIKNNVIDFTGFDPNTMAGCTYGGGCIQAKAGSGPQTIIEDNYVAFGAADTYGHEGIASWGMHDADVIIRGNTVAISSTGAVNKYHNGIVLHGTNGGSALIDNNTIYVSQLVSGMWRHYGIYILGNGAIGEYLNNVNITNNNVTGPGYCSWAGKSTGYALRMSGPNTNNIDIMYNEFKDYEFGMVVENDASCNDVHVNCNNIFGNDHGLVTGVNYTISVPTLDATHNWWGHATGPFHAVTNPLGQGDPVSDNVNYDNWAYIPDFCDCEAKTIGYWKNHPDYVEGILIELEYSMEVGTETITEALAGLIFDKPNSKTYQMLAAQLLAAKLNVAQLSQFITGYDSGCVDAAIVAADGILAIHDYSVKLEKEDKDYVNSIKDVLDGFNNYGCEQVVLCPCTCY